MALEQEKDAIQTKLDKVTKELENACVANHDVEAKSCLPFLIGKVRQTPLLAFGDSFMKSER